MKNRNLDHKDDWKTPEKFYKILDNIFKFDFDPCPFQNDIEKFDGLKVEWGKSNYVNPPYSSKLKTAFVKKAIEEYKNGKLCVLLLPVSTSTKLFHDLIIPCCPDIAFIKGRISFEGYNSKGEYVTNKKCMHDSFLIILDPKKLIKT